jgi:hypothetical protein
VGAVVAVDVETGGAQFGRQLGAGVDADVTARHLGRVILVAQLPIDRLGELGGHRGREAPARAQHSHHLADCRHIVLDVFEHLRRDHDVERVVWKGQFPRVAAQYTGQPVGSDLAGLDHRRQRVSRLDHLVGGVVEGDHSRAAPCALVHVAAEAGADVEHSVAGLETERVESDGEHQSRPLRRSLAMF